MAQPRPAVVEPAVAQRWIAWIVHVSGAEREGSFRKARRQLHVAAEAATGLVVILLGDDRPIRKLSLKVERTGGRAWQERAEHGPPVRAIGMDRPQTPKRRAAQSLRLQRAEHDAAIHED